MAKVNIGGNEYPLILSLEALSSFEGGFSEIENLLNLKDNISVEKKLCDWVKLLTVLANAGAKQQAYMNKTFGFGERPLPQLSEEDVMMLMSPIDILECKDVIAEAVGDGVHRRIVSDDSTDETKK